MDMYDALELARDTARTLDGLVWAIGGSVLLGRIGLEPRPNDLDIVTSNEDYAEAFERLTMRFGRPMEGAGDSRLSEEFARFTDSQGNNIDLVAFIGRPDFESPIFFALTRDKIEFVDSLPWMRPEDWLLIYSIFERPHRVTQLKYYFDSKSNAEGSRNAN